MSYEWIHSEIIYPGRAFTIRRDTIRLPDGRQAGLDIVDHAGSVVIVPLDDSGNLLFIRQYRHAVGTQMLELPAGTLEEGESPEECAHREIREETGLAARDLREVGGFFLAPGYSTEFMHVFLATGLYPAPLEPDADEWLSVVKVPLREALGLPFKGELPDAKSLGAFFLVRNLLEQISKG